MSPPTGGLDGPYPGLVTFLDPATLALPENARAIRVNLRGSDRAAGKLRPFLVLAIEDDGVLCVPLFRAGGTGHDRRELVQELKAGGGPLDNWTSQTSAFSIYQFWIVPLDIFRQAARADLTPSGHDKTYAVDAPEALDEIIACRSCSSEGFHPLAED
ncbi:hypothetical protein ACRC7T_10825 [Segnochrobactraceae bacterium EtOH-i3]